MCGVEDEVNSIAFRFDVFHRWSFNYVRRALPHQEWIDRVDRLVTVCAFALVHVSDLRVRIFRTDFLYCKATSPTAKVDGLRLNHIDAFASAGT